MNVFQSKLTPEETDHLEHYKIISRDESIINKARLNKQLENHLECTIPDSIYEEIINIINNSK